MSVYVVYSYVNSANRNCDESLNGFLVGAVPSTKKKKKKIHHLYVARVRRLCSAIFLYREFSWTLMI